MTEIFGASHEGLGRGISSREVLFAQGCGKGDPDTQSGLGKIDHINDGNDVGQRPSILMFKLVSADCSNDH